MASAKQETEHSTENGQQLHFLSLQSDVTKLPMTSQKNHTLTYHVPKLLVGKPRKCFYLKICMTFLIV